SLRATVRSHHLQDPSRRERRSPRSSSRRQSSRRSSPITLTTTSPSASLSRERRLSARNLPAAALTTRSTWNHSACHAASSPAPIFRTSASSSASFSSAGADFGACTAPDAPSTRVPTVVVVLVMPNRFTSSSILLTVHLLRAAPPGAASFALSPSGYGEA